MKLRMQLTSTLETPYADLENILKYFCDITKTIITHRLSSMIHYDNIFILQESDMLSFI